MTRQEPVNTATNDARIAAVPGASFRAVAWIGPVVMILGTAIGSGEILSEPAAGARYGGTLLWVIVIAVITKASWNEAIGRVSIATGQSFLEACRGAGPIVAWVPWAWYAVNSVKDFFLRGGIMAIGGSVCFDTFGPLPDWLVPPVSMLPWLGSLPVEQQIAKLHTIAWTLWNFGLVWLLLVVGGYQVAEKINTVLCLVFTLCLMACAAAVFPQVVDELARGLVPRVPTGANELLMLVSLAGIVMAGSATVFYSAWTEERQMGLFGHVHQLGRRLTPAERQPVSQEEVRRMHGWLRINRVNVGLGYILGGTICLSTFVLGVGILRPAGADLSGTKTELARELSLMMTHVLGPWARSVFYLGTWAAVVSTIVAVFDGSSRIFVQPVRQFLPSVYGKLSFAAWQKALMTAMLLGSFSVYALKPHALRLVLWMGAVDAPLVGILFLGYAYLARCYLPREYRKSLIWSLIMAGVGVLYLAVSFYAGWMHLVVAGK